jgi:zinc transport system substrate-binding protein
MKPTAAVSLTLVAGFLLGACGGAAQADGPRVVASFYPYAFVAEQVGGSHIEVDNLTSPGVEPHDVELKPQQVGAVQSADLVIYQRGFQNAVDDAVDQADLPGDDVLDVATILRRDEALGDPHVWLDPSMMVTVVRAVEKRLSTADPDRASVFAAKAQHLERELTQLDSDFTGGLKTCRTRTIVTSHAAFHHLAERYRLTQVPIAGIDPTNEPTPSQLADISSLVKREGITTIFTEELVSPAIAETVAQETGARTATLDPIEGLGDEGTGSYLTLMRRNLDAIRTANGCS